MKGTALAGVVLIVIGVVGFAFGHISYTTKEKAIDLGPIEVMADKKHNIAIPDIAAALALIAGVGLVLAGARSNS